MRGERKSTLLRLYLLSGAGPQQSTLQFGGSTFPVEDQKSMLVEAAAVGNLPLGLLENPGLSHIICRATILQLV